MDEYKSPDSEHHTHDQSSTRCEEKRSQRICVTDGAKIPSSPPTLSCHPDLDPDSRRPRLSGTSDVKDVLVCDAETGSSTRHSALRQRAGSREECNGTNQEQMSRGYPDTSPYPSGSVQVSPTSHDARSDDRRLAKANDITGTDCRVYPTPSKKERMVEVKRSRSQIERLKSLTIPNNSSFRQLARQLSRTKCYRVRDERESGNSGTKPKNYFDLALVTMCCCMSPLGIVAILMSVLSNANYRAGHLQKALTYSKLALTFSIIGIISTIVIAITLLMLYRYPWKEVSHL